MLYADAKNVDGVPLAVKCEWFRVLGDRAVKVPQVNSNIYQMCAEDVGYHIKVKAIPIDTQAETGATGIAFG